jgi:hypothetical protein
MRECGVGMKEQKHYVVLLEQYRSIWNNRLLTEMEMDSEAILVNTIRRELLDENSHPRVRKNRYQKYYSAIKRVITSSVSNETKIDLIELHNQIMEDLGQEGK